jgi:hypothetical protein
MEAGKGGRGLRHRFLSAFPFFLLHPMSCRAGQGDVRRRETRGSMWIDVGIDATRVQPSRVMRIVGQVTCTGDSRDAKARCITHRCTLTDVHSPMTRGDVQQSVQNAAAPI